jgi:hypothetical protein
MRSFLSAQGKAGAAGKAIGYSPRVRYGLVMRATYSVTTGRRTPIPHYLHGIGEPTLYASEDEALAQMNALMAKLEAKGYTRKAHASDARFILTHPTEGFVDVYVNDEP